MRICFDRLFLGLAALLAGGGAPLAASLEPAPPAAVGVSAGRLEEVAAALRAEVARGAIPGAVVAVARRGRLVYHEAVG
ncbi:MAG: hypothetical protein RL479_1614, partial [Verrucomicrobiota bacterium]